MSQFNPAVPAYVPPEASLQFDGQTFNFYEANQLVQNILASSSLSATTSIASINNPGCRGAMFLMNVTQMPGSASTTLAMKLYLTAGGITADFAARTPISATGCYVFTVYPGVSASAGGVSSPLPRQFGMRISASYGATSKECVFSISMLRID
ncbi:MAG TPA: hypothetical protein VF443_01790 [Nitrospira sp.]